jgi:hypothetical protein
MTKHNVARILWGLAWIGLLLGIALPASGPGKVQPASAATDQFVHLGDRDLDVGPPAVTLFNRGAAPRGSVATAADLADVSLTVRLTNRSARHLRLQASHFTLSAEGDMFGLSGIPAANSAALSLAPQTMGTEHLAFVVPSGALRRLSLFYRPAGESIAVSIPLGAATPAQSTVTATAPATATATATPLATVPAPASVPPSGLSLTGNLTGLSHAGNLTGLSQAGPNAAAGWLRALSLPLAGALAAAPSAAAAGSVLAQDSFQRPNQTFWGTASDGHVWAGDANNQ